MTNTVAPTPVAFSLNDAVCLLDPQRHVPAGALGRVLGRFARETNPTYAVIFVDYKVAVLELRPDEIVLADDFRVAA